LKPKLQSDKQYQDFEIGYFKEHGYHCRNYRLNDSKTLVEFWIKNLCVYLIDKENLEEGEYRTDDYDEHFLKVITESEMIDAQSIMSEIESIWRLKIDF